MGKKFFCYRGLWLNWCLSEPLCQLLRFWLRDFINESVIEFRYIFRCIFAVTAHINHTSLQCYFGYGFSKRNDICIIMLHLKNFLSSELGFTEPVPIV